MTSLDGATLTDFFDAALTIGNISHELGRVVKEVLDNEKAKPDAERMPISDFGDVAILKILSKQSFEKTEGLKTQYKTTNVSHRVKKLSEAGLVEQVQSNPEDKREKRLQITQEGRNILEIILPKIEKKLTGILSQAFGDSAGQNEAQLDLVAKALLGVLSRA